MRITLCTRVPDFNTEGVAFAHREQSDRYRHGSCADHNIWTDNNTATAFN